MSELVETDVDRARAEAALAIAKVVVPKLSEGRVEAQRFDLAPILKKAPPPLHEGARVAVAEQLDGFQAKAGALRFFLKGARTGQRAAGEDASAG